METLFPQLLVSRCHGGSHDQWKWHLMIWQMRQVIKEKNITAILDSKQHGIADLWQPSGWNIPKIRLYFIKFLQILLLCFFATVIRMQLVAWNISTLLKVHHKSTSKLISHLQTQTPWCASNAPSVRTRWRGKLTWSATCAATQARGRIPARPATSASRVWSIFEATLKR